MSNLLSVFSGNDRRAGRMRVAGALAGIIVLTLWLIGHLDRTEFLARDTLVQILVEPVESDLVIVEIDAASLEAIGQWPWPRALYSDALKALADAGVASVMLDVDLSARSDPEQDQLLANTLADLSTRIPVRLPVFVQQNSRQNPELIFRSPLAGLAVTGDLVAVNMRPESDGLVRFLDDGILWQGQKYPAAWNAISGIHGQPTWVDYTIDPASFRYVSFIDLIDGQVDLRDLRGRDVLIGATAIELGDILAVPVHRALPGVVIQALGTQTLIRGGLFRTSGAADILILALFWLVAMVLIRRVSWKQGMAFSFVATAAWLLLAWFAYQEANLMLPLVAPLLLTWLAYLAMMIARLDIEILERLLAQKRLRDEQALLDRIVATANDCILCADEQGKITRMNPAMRRLTGYDEADLLGLPLRAVLPGLPIETSQVSRVPFDGKLLDATGRELPVEVTISDVNMGQYLVHTVVIRDLTERVQREEELHYQATHDSLTGLLNRSEFFNRLGMQLQQWGEGSLLVFDLDYFQEVNDTYGHDLGDQLLCQTGRRLGERLGADMLLARVGGDTFAIWLPRMGCNDGAGDWARQLMRTFEAPMLLGEAHDSVRLQVSGTLGLCEANDGVSSDAEGLLRRATNAMLLAKKEGLASRWFTEDDNREAVRRLELVPAIRNGIRTGEFRLAFQPKINLQDDTVMGAEVLLRWPQAERSGIPVGTFIEVAEGSRQIAPLTLWVMEQVLEQEENWRDTGLPRHLAINLSARLIHDAAFIRQLNSLLRGTRGYYHLELEITETAFMANQQRAVAHVKMLKEAGATLSIDDYGTGYSSLAYLRDLNAHVLKIDRSFVTNISERPDNQVIVRSTINMAHDLGMKVVSEGIETTADREFLVSSGCDYGQGYLFARPMLTSEFIDYLRDQRS